MNGRFVTGCGMIDAAQHVVLVGPPRKEGQMLRDGEPRHTGRNWLKLTAYLRGSVGLQIPCVEMRTTPLEQNHNRLSSRSESLLVICPGDAKPKRWKSKGRQRHTAASQEPTTVPSPQAAVVN